MKVALKWRPEVATNEDGSGSVTPGWCQCHQIRWDQNKWPRPTQHHLSFSRRAKNWADKRGKLFSGTLFLLDMNGGWGGGGGGGSQLSADIDFWPGSNASTYFSWHFSHSTNEVLAPPRLLSPHMRSQPLLTSPISLTWLRSFFLRYKKSVR